jgi:hypothetical protein
MRVSRLSVFALVGLLGSSTLVFAQEAPVSPAVPAPAPVAAPAAATPAAPSAAVAAQAGDPNQIVCRTMAPATGTRLGARRICQTQREWDDASHQAQQELQKLDSVGAHLMNSSN